MDFSQATWFDTLIKFSSSSSQINLLDNNLHERSIVEYILCTNSVAFVPLFRLLYIRSTRVPVYKY